MLTTHAANPLESDSNRFVLFSQPIIELDSGRVSHHELLLRIEHPDGNFATPATFGAAIREQGIEGQIDRWVAEQALAMMKPEKARPGPQLEINISRHSAIGSELPNFLNEELPRRGIGPDALIVEVEQGESVHPDEMRGFGNRAFQLACHFSGVNSDRAALVKLLELQEMPFDYVKIAGEFVRELAESASDQAIVRRVARIASSYGRRTVALHVQDDAALSILREAGVDYGQGFLLGKPEPISST